MSKSKAKRNRKSQLAIILLLAAACTIGVYFGGRYIQRVRIQRWRDEGIAASKAGEHAHAAELLAQYIRRRPWDIEALRHFIKSRESSELPNGQHLAETIGALKLALREQPDSLDDRRHLLELYVKVDRRPEALDIAKSILVPPNDKDIRTLELKIEVLARLGQYREALQVAEVWTATEPLNLKTQMTRLTLRRRLDHSPQEIISDAQKLREAHPGDPRFEILQGFAYGQKGDREQAAKWLKLAIGNTRPLDDFAPILIAELNSQELCDNSLELLEQWVKSGAPVEFQNMLAGRYWETNRWEQTVTALAALDPADPKSDLNLIAFKAIALSNSKKLPEAKACLAAMSGRDHPAARAWTMLLQRVIESASTDDKVLFANCQEALRRDPTNTYLAYFMGEACQRLGEGDLAAEIWKQVVTTNRTWSTPVVRLADLLLTRGQTLAALEVASAGVRRSPTNLTAAVTLARVLEGGLENGTSDRPEELLKLVEEIQRLAQPEDRTLAIRIHLLARKGQKDEAIKLARLALTRMPPPDEAFFIRLSSISSRFGLGIEQECIVQSEKSNGLSSTLAYVGAVQRASVGQAADGLKLFDEMAARSKKAGELGWQLSRAQFLDLIDDPNSKATWVQLGDNHPKDLTVQRAVSNSSAARRNRELMQRTADRLKALTGENAMAWRLIKARMLVESPRNADDYVEGSKLLSGIVQTYPQMVEPRVLLAMALIHMNRVDGAIDQLTAAAELDPTSAPIALQLAALHQSRGNTEKSQKELDRISKWLQSPQQRHQTAMLFAQQGNRDRAIQILEEARDLKGGGRPDLYLAVLYGQRNELDKAEAVLKKLMEKPDLPTIQLAAILYASQGRKAEADKVLAQLDTLKLEPGIKELSLALHHSRMGQMKEAIEQCKLATRRAPGNRATWLSLIELQATSGQIADVLASAEEGLKALPGDESLSAIQSRSGLLNQASAEQDLHPVILSFIRNPSNAKAAAELLQTVLDERRSGDMERLAGRLQQLAERYSTYLQVHVQLIQCNWDMGRKTDALAAANRALTLLPNDPEPARIAANLCFASQRWQEMLAAAQIWKKRAIMDRTAADVAIAQALIGLEQYDSAIAQLQPYFAKTQAPAEAIGAYCTALARLGRAPAAANLLWPLAQKDPQWRAIWIQIAESSLDGPQAADWLERVSAIIKPEAIDERAVVAEAYNRLGRRLEEQKYIQKSSTSFAQLLTDPKANAAIVLVAGMQAEQRGDVALAETSYRRALALKKDFEPALNNLAYLLAHRGSNLQEALEYANSAVKLAPRQATVYDTLALVQFKTGNPKSAAETMIQAIKLEPDTAKWRVRLARYQFESGNSVDAGKTLDSLARLDLATLPPETKQQMAELRKQLKPTPKR